MAIPISCRCGYRSTVRDEQAGQKVLCPSCRVLIYIKEPENETAPLPSPFKRTPGHDTGTVHPPREQLTQPTVITKREYKVLSPKDIWSGGQFESEKLERLLNLHAEEGWELKSVVTPSIPGLRGNRQGFVIILERS